MEIKFRDSLDCKLINIYNIYIAGQKEKLNIELKKEKKMRELEEQLADIREFQVLYIYIYIS